MSGQKAPAAATESGFSWNEAEALGCKWVAQKPPYVASWRVDGASLEWTGETVPEVLRQIEGWHVIRLRRGAAVPVRGPVVGIIAGPGTTANLAPVRP